MEKEEEEQKVHTIISLLEPSYRLLEKLHDIL